MRHSSTISKPSFGSSISEMSFSSDTLGGYRYGFNNQEKDDEISGKGDYYAFEYRIQDTRIGRFLSIDPLSKKFPFYSPYQFASNSPIVARELEGLESSLTLNTTEKKDMWNSSSSTPSFDNSSKGFVFTTAKDVACVTPGRITYSSISIEIRTNNAVNDHPEFASQIEHILNSGKDLTIHNDVSQVPNAPPGTSGAFTYQSNGNYSIYLNDMSAWDLEQYGVDPIYEELFHMTNCFNVVSGYTYNNVTQSYEITNANLLNEEARAKFSVVTQINVQQYYVFNTSTGLAPVVGTEEYYAKSYTSMGALIGKTEAEIETFISSGRGSPHPIDVYYQLMYKEWAAFSQYSRPQKKALRTNTTNYPQEGVYDNLR